MTAPILVIEDKHHDILLTQRALVQARIKAPLQVVTDGDEAVRYLSGAAPFEDRLRYPAPILILLDLKLPCLGGHEVLAWINETPELASARLPVVVVSTSNEAGDRELALGLGAHRYLVKPLSPEMLAGTLREVGLGELMDD